jgi:hypothetical protein
MSVPTRLERCQDAVVWWWPEFKNEDSIPLVIRDNVREKITNEDWEDAYEIMAEYLAK